MAQALFIVSPEFQKRLEEMIDTDSIASHDKFMVKRIEDWLKYNVSGIDIARIYVALVEADEIKANLTVTRFVVALKISLPEVKIFGTRQVQKEVNTLKICYLMARDMATTCLYKLL